ncbi:hypothetical protein CBP51_00130 [Cellvibrio mixtus]|uniref:Uncharacterized protein n=1 Tax=Cellvibrio mixtus TaxID=39650 RepID=A0A266Q6I4_9GAMM|nr:hypothetical protein [Cellvibrio mixtus]OZY83159.1 hypothetical protein CBP51_20445 [Cellvibrio mixtus]OZY85486.1 hypothetical protein CBP51_00075 [Cellvibrio mixtus]OZY85497.1 hypothetical protein CBP51_00130 [Cellvibrio mixtus]
MDAKKILASMVAKVLEDGHSVVETVSVSRNGVSVQMCEGLIRYFVDGDEVSALDAFDHLDDRIN